MKNILITGHKGFIGSHLKRELDKKGFITMGIDLPEYDITDKDSFHDLEDICFGKVFHLAGLNYIPDSWKNPERFFEVNFTSTLHVLEFCRKTGSALTFISCYLYGRPVYLPIDEKHPVQPLNPYHKSKLFAEELCCFYQEHFNVPVVILRPFNIYGPGQRKDFLIPSIIGQLIDDRVEQVTINDPIPCRDYLFIDDFTNALVSTLQLENGLFNVGSGSSASVAEITNLLIKISAKEKKINITNQKRIDEIDDLYSNCSRLREVSGWTPSVSLEDGLNICLSSENLKKSE